MDWLAQSMRFFPMSASSMFLTSQFTCVGVVDILCCASPVARCAKIGYESKACLVLTLGLKPYEAGVGAALKGRSSTARLGLYFFTACVTGSCFRPASLANFSALSVFSQVNSG